MTTSVPVFVAGTFEDIEAKIRRDAEGEGRHLPVTSSGCVCGSWKRLHGIEASSTRCGSERIGRISGGRMQGSTSLLARDRGSCGPFKPRRIIPAERSPSEKSTRSCRNRTARPQVSSSCGTRQPNAKRRPSVQAACGVGSPAHSAGVQHRRSDAGRSDRLGQGDAEIRSAKAHHVPLVGGEGRAVRRCHAARFLADDPSLNAVGPAFKKTLEETHSCCCV